MGHPAETLKLKTFFKNRYEKEQEQHGDLSQLKNNGSNDGKSSTAVPGVYSHLHYISC